jgi:hypothetical protein
VAVAAVAAAAEVPPVEVLAASRFPGAQALNSATSLGFSFRLWQRGCEVENAPLNTNVASANTHAARHFHFLANGRQASVTDRSNPARYTDSSRQAT